MNKSTHKLERIAPMFVNAIVAAISLEYDNVRCDGPLIVSELADFRATMVTIHTDHPVQWEVKISHLIAAEETISVVFTTREGTVESSKTRHYQPRHYLGLKSPTELMDHVADLKMKVLLTTTNAADIHKKHDAIDKGEGVNKQRSNIYATNVTRQDEENIHLDIFEFLKDGTLPKPLTA